MKLSYKIYTLINYTKRIIKGETEQTKYFKYIKSIQHLPQKQLLSLQAKELVSILKYSFDNIEYYKKYKDTIKLDPETIFDEIRKIPPLLKKDIINNPKLYINPKIKKVIKYNTGGTSSASAIIYKGMSEQLKSSDEYFNHMHNIYSGKSRLILKRHQLMYLYSNTVQYTKKFQPFRKTYYFDVQYMSNTRLESIYKLCKRVKPKVIIGITRPVYDFARFIETTKRKIHKFDLVITGGQTLLPKYRKTIEKVFNAPLINRYASTELGDVATQCIKREGLHYIPTLYYIEILDKNMNQVKEGEIGEMYVTVLQSRVFPLIRYKTNDYAIYTNKPCTCDITFPTIKHIMGRDIESLRAPNHSVITPMPIDNVLSKYPNIIDFQAIQNNINGFTLFLVIKEKNLSKEIQSKIKHDLCDLFNYNMIIDIVIKNKLKKLPNGKMLHIISKV